MINTTIAAIATPPGEGGIAVIRVSGENAIAVCDRIFSGKKTLSESASHTLHYGHIKAGERILDEVLVGVMRAPHSYTGEDVVEISCHGGTYVTQSVLSAILENGAIMASPGEFTKRAFLNGKLDLSQAEAVIDLIQAESKEAATLSVNQLDGKLSAPIQEQRSALLSLTAHLDAMADFPDEGIGELSEETVRVSIERSKQTLSSMCEQAEQGRMIRNGINTVIVGKPNVGKSSLLNALSGTDRALVTGEAGTTRDVIEERIRLGAARLNIFDTAGIREGAGEIEEMGIQKALSYVKQADLIFFVLDATFSFAQEDEEIAELIQDKKTIILINKTDVADTYTLPERFAHLPVIRISAKTGMGIKELAETVETMFRLGEVSENHDAAVINMRHKQAIFEAIQHLDSALDALSSGMPLDFLSVVLRAAVSALGEITGQTVSDEIIDEIFSRFCLGK